MTYRLVTFVPTDSATPRAGMIVGDRVHDLTEASEDALLTSVLSILVDWDRARPLLERLAAEFGNRAGAPLADVDLLTPVHVPPAVFCAGSNYADHVRNMEARMGIPPSPDPRGNAGKPFHFLKASRCCVGTGAIVHTPSPALDWEGELVVVIGRQGRNVAVEDAMNLVAGYMVGNDLSARDIAFKANFPAPSIFNHSFLEHKSFEHAAPVGPWFTPAEAISDVDSLVLRTFVNGDLKQEARCGDMTFSIPEQLSHLSSIITLMPGDIVMAGTPAGVGAESGTFLSAGDVVTVEIERLGQLVTTIA